MNNFYDPTAEHLEKLSEPWCCSYSGGKDSTSLVTWIEWLRRAGWITVERPKLVRSDTGVEEVDLMGVAEDMTAILEASGWDCSLVQPLIHERLYNRILGIGNCPVHPGGTKMRWCTRATKIDPMKRERKKFGKVISLTGLRLGESAIRDGKIKSGCAAGGECGIPDPGEGKYSPILHWKTCQVIDWLSGMVYKEVRDLMGDIFPVTQRLVEIYGVTMAVNLWEEQEVLTAARFGCIGCPAIGVKREPPRSVIRRNGRGSPLNELYDVWHEARLPKNRCVNMQDGHFGPIRMEVRKVLFARVLDIQQRAGIVLITPEDEAFIRDCWARNVYPRGWSEADELTEMPNTPLYYEFSS
jgi:DNA sulfur modification protein DndC